MRRPFICVSLDLILQMSYEREQMAEYVKKHTVDVTQKVKFLCCVLYDGIWQFDNHPKRWEMIVTSLTVRSLEI